MTQRSYHLESSQADRIAWDEMTKNEARALFALEDMAQDRTRRGAEVAALSWANTETLLEQETLWVDDAAEAKARYLDAFARAWDAERAAHVLRITTGVLGGNLLADEKGLDTLATMSAYVTALHVALRAAYPDADIQIFVDPRAQGSMPAALRTHVYYASGDVQVEDGGLCCHDANVAAVDEIAQEVFERSNWYVAAGD